VREDGQKLKEEKTKLEGMVESRDKLIMEITKETRIDCLGEDVEDEDVEDEDDDDGGDIAAPPATAPPLSLRALLLLVRRSSSRMKTIWRWFPREKTLWCMR
jgi:hypothetical protein